MPHTAEAPKCFAEVKGRRILDWGLDALAAAYAAAGQFAPAVTTHGVAVRLAEELGARTAAAELRRRLAMYQRREPYIGR